MSKEIQDVPGLTAILAEVRKSNMSVHSLWKLYNFINNWAEDQRLAARAGEIKRQQEKSNDIESN